MAGLTAREAVYGEEVAASIDRYTAPWFEHQLVPVWIPAMPDVRALLEAGATAARVRQVPIDDPFNNLYELTR